MGIWLPFDPGHADSKDRTGGWWKSSPAGAASRVRMEGWSLFLREAGGCKDPTVALRLFLPERVVFKAPMEGRSQFPQDIEDCRGLTNEWSLLRPANGQFPMRAAECAINERRC